MLKFFNNYFINKKKRAIFEVFNGTVYTYKIYSLRFNFFLEFLLIFSPGSTKRYILKTAFSSLLFKIEAQVNAAKGTARKCSAGALYVHGWGGANTSRAQGSVAPLPVTVPAHGPGQLCQSHEAVLTDDGWSLRPSF